MSPPSFLFLSSSRLVERRIDSRLHLPDRPHLDAAETRRRTARGGLDRLVQVPGLDQVISAELLLGLGERAVGGYNIAVADPHRGRGPDGLQAIEPHQAPRFFDAFGKISILGI